MLRLFKNSSQNTLRQIQPLFFLSTNNKSLQTDVTNIDVEKKFQQRYTKNRAIKEVVEQLFFQDHSKETQKQLIKEELINQSTNTDDVQSEIELNQTEQSQQFKKVMPPSSNLNNPQIQYAKEKNLSQLEQLQDKDAAEQLQQQINKQQTKLLLQNQQQQSIPLSISPSLAYDLAQLDSSAKTALTETRKNQPEKREDIILFIQRIENNEHLLAFYLKYNKMFGKGEISTLIQKLDDNLQNIEEIKLRQMEQYKRKKEKLKKLNKNIEPITPGGGSNGLNFLTKEQIIRHDGFRHLLRKIQYKIDKVLSPRAAVHMMYRVSLFTKSIPQELILTFRQKFEPHITTLDVLPLVLYLTFLCNMLMQYQYQDGSANTKKDSEIRTVMHLIMTTLSQRSFEGVNHVTILSLARLYLQSRQRLMRHQELMAKLEPIVLQNLSKYSFRQVGDIFISYISQQYGSKEFLQILMFDLLRKLDDTRLSFHVGVILLSLPRRKKLQIRKGIMLDFSPLYEVLLKKVVQSIPTQSINYSQIYLLLTSLTKNDIDQKQFFEFISVEFIKRLDAIPLNKFASCYFLLAMSNISSKPIIHLSEKKIRQELDKLDQIKQTKPVGYLQKKERDILKEAQDSKLYNSIQDQQQGQAQQQQQKAQQQNNNSNQNKTNLNKNNNEFQSSQQVNQKGFSPSYNWHFNNSAIPVSYEDNQIKKITTFLKICWSYIFFVLKDNELPEKIDYKSIARLISHINEIIKELEISSERYFGIFRIFIEMINQINYFVRNSGHNLIPYQIEISQLIKNKYIQIKNLKYPTPVSEELLLFLLEKKYFFRKYSKFLERDSNYLDFIFHWRVVNPEKRVITLFYINEGSDYLGKQQKGLVFLRNYYVDKKKIPYKTIDFITFLDSLKDIKQLKTGYFENEFQSLLPPVQEEPDNEKLKDIKEKINFMRKKVIHKLNSTQKKAEGSSSNLEADDEYLKEEYQLLHDEILKDEGEGDFSEYELSGGEEDKKNQIKNNKSNNKQMAKTNYNKNLESQLIQK